MQSYHQSAITFESWLSECPKCKKLFKCIITLQIDEGSNMQEKTCPYCKAIIEESDTYAYLCSSLTQSEIDYLERIRLKRVNLL